LDKFYIKITGDESRGTEAEFFLQKLNDMGEIGDVLINFLRPGCWYFQKTQR
jgi:hypothetical protein